MKGFVESEEIKSRANGLKNQSQLFVDAMNKGLSKKNISYWGEHPLSDALLGMKEIELYKIDRVFYDESQSINGRIINVYNSLLAYDFNVLVVIVGDKFGINFYIGLGKITNENPLPAMILQKNLKGCFPGITLKTVNDIDTIFNNINDKSCVSVVSGIPKTRDDAEDGFVQGIEKLIDAMNGEEYIALMVAEPITKAQLQKDKKYYEDLYSGLSESTEWVLNFSEEKSTSVTNSSSKETGKSTSTNKSDSKGTGHSQDKSRTDVSSSGTSQGEEKLVNIWNKINNVSEGTNTTNGESDSTSDSHTEGSSESTTESSSAALSNTESGGSNGSIQVTQQNKMIVDLLNQVNSQIERIYAAESMGAWNCAAYFIANPLVSEVCANIYKSLIVGENAYPDEYLLYSWNENCMSPLQYNNIVNSLKRGGHPKFLYNDIEVTPATMVNGSEIPLLGGFPQKSVNGFTVMSGTSFGRNMSCNTENERIEIGALYHMGETFDANRVCLDVNSLSSHCFITGSTGSGKSNTTYKLLTELNKKNIKFMVIEPAKGEYKLEFANLEGINIYTTNPRYYSMLAINPFEFNEEIHVLEHLERLLEIFSACWPLYAAMPAVLKDTFERSYIEHGWDLQQSIYTDLGNGKFPTMADALKYLPIVVRESRFAGETRDNYIGALHTRLRSLTTGVIGKIFEGSALSDTTLFEENTIIDLSRLGSSETKSLLMGLLVLKLSEHRMASRVRNAPLKHVTVIEEAHNLLKRTSLGSKGQESADVQGKSVEMISGFIAETRTYGEGFVIVDQSPTAIDVSAIKNTNTKIAMRLPEAYDAEAVGHAMGLSEKQILELSRLDKGVAAIYQSGWQEPVLVKIDKSDEQFSSDILEENSSEKRRVVNGLMVSEIINQYFSNCKNDNAIKRIIETSDVNKGIKSSLYNYYGKYCSDSICGDKNRALLECVISVLGCADMLRVFEGKLPDRKVTQKEQVTNDIINQAIEWKRLVLKNIVKYVDVNSSELLKQILLILVKYGIEFSYKKNQYQTLLYCLKEEHNRKNK